MKQAIDESQLDDAVRGKVAGLSPQDAVSRLARSKRADRDDILCGLIDHHAVTELRYRAALALSMAPNARKRILERLATAEPMVRAGLLLSLARVGEPDDLAAMTAASHGLAAHNARRARFATLLLAHRHSLPEAKVPAPAPVNTVLPAKQARRFMVGAPAEAAGAWARFSSAAHLGMIPDPATASVIEGKQCRTLVVLADSFGAEDVASGRRAVAGVLGVYDRETGAWNHDSWVLTSNQRVDVWTLGGKHIYSGTAGVASSGLVSFRVATVATTGLAPLVAEGHLRDGRIALDDCHSDPFAKRPVARPLLR